MKRTIGLVAAVILVGAFVVACNQKPTEPTSTPAPSPTPAATEEPATTPEPSPSSQPVEQVTEEGPTNEGATYEAEPSREYEDMVNQIMNEFGFSREKAEELVNAGLKDEADRTQTIQERQEEEAARMEQEKQQADKEYDEFCMEHYGTTGDHWNSMTFEEKGAWMESHPMN